MKSISIFSLLIALLALSASAAEPIRYSADVLVETASGDFAPSLIAAQRHGKITQRENALIDLGLHRDLDTLRRFAWSYGVEAIGGYSSRADYDRYDAAMRQWYTHSEGPAAVWLQQLYGAVKYRGVRLMVGMQQTHSMIVDPDLSTGDLVESGNARPIPQARIGFIDFQDIPFTHGWAQIYGTVAYGKFADAGWSKAHYNYYTNHLSIGEWYSYKNIYLRSNPRKPLVVTIGAQWGGQFGGETTWYVSGADVRYEKRTTKFKDFWKMMLPTQTDKDGYYYGNHIGSLDIKAEYHLRGGHTIGVYTQWPWEDGSGLRKGNGWDGLWGLEYHAAGRTWVTGAVFEYLCFTNQSGPLHYAPGDHPESDIDHNATGADDYYNNFYYSSWTNYGMGIGSSFLVSPLYNLDGYPQYLHNRARGWQLAVQGWFTPEIQYTLKVASQTAWGNGRIPVTESLSMQSWSIAVGYDAAKLTPGLTLSAQLAADYGSLRGRSWGALLCASYTGNFSLGKRK